jgi:hypothetical protein
MTGDAYLNDIVLFDVPGLAQACALAMRLGSRWPCHAYQESDNAVVGVFLAPERDWELAPLLRDVQDWIAERSVDGVTFWLDGRGYVLRGGETTTLAQPSHAYQ